jgi:hypothetical protein
MLILVLVPALPCLRDSTRINPGRSWESKEHWHRCPVLAEAASPASASGCWANSSRGFHTLLETKKKSGVSEMRKRVAGVQHRQRCRPEHWIGTPQLSFGAAALLRLYSTWTNRDPAAAARMSVRLTMRVLFIRNLARSIPAARQRSLLLASSMQRTARSSKKFFHRRRNVRDPLPVLPTYLGGISRPANGICRGTGFISHLNARIGRLSATPSPPQLRLHLWPHMYLLFQSCGVASKSVTGQIESDIDSSATRRRESEGRVKLTLSQQSGCCGEKRGKAESPSAVY